MDRKFYSKVFGRFWFWAGGTWVGWFQKKVCAHGSGPRSQVVPQFGPKAPHPPLVAAQRPSLSPAPVRPQGDLYSGGLDPLLPDDPEPGPGSDLGTPQPYSPAPMRCGAARNCYSPINEKLVPLFSSRVRRAESSEWILVGDVGEAGTQPTAESARERQRHR